MKFGLTIKTLRKMQTRKTRSEKEKPVLNVGIVGFGLSGQVFHAPFIDVNPHFNLHTIVTTGTLAAEKYCLKYLNFIIYFVY